jgi:osmotically inducible lipoprotein OsmB
MNRNLVVSCALVGAVALAGCASMSDTDKRVGTGAAIGAAAAGVISGEWGWAAAGAAAGALGGYLYDQSKKNEQKAYEQGVKDGQKKN